MGRLCWSRRRHRRSGKDVLNREPMCMWGKSRAWILECRGVFPHLKHRFASRLRCSGNSLHNAYNVSLHATKFRGDIYYNNYQNIYITWNWQYIDMIPLGGQCGSCSFLTWDGLTTLNTDFFPAHSSSRRHRSSDSLLQKYWLDVRFFTPDQHGGVLSIR